LPDAIEFARKQKTTVSSRLVAKTTMASLAGVPHGTPQWFVCADIRV
jgi:hypothetical protein